MWRASVTGSMSAAIDDACRLYHKRKADALRARKLPELMPGAAITFAELVKAARNYTNGITRPRCITLIAGCRNYLLTSVRTRRRQRFAPSMSRHSLGAYGVPQQRGIATAHFEPHLPAGGRLWGGRIQSLSQGPARAGAQRSRPLFERSGRAHATGRDSPRLSASRARA